MANERNFYEKKGAGMDTTIMIKAASSLLPPIINEKLDKSFLLLSELEKRFSRFDKESELTKLNNTNKGRFVEVSDLFYQLIKYSLSLAKKSGGLFDPTIADYMEAYGYDEKRSFQPNNARLTALKKERSNYTNIQLWLEPKMVKLSPLLKMDFGAVAKGYAIDIVGQFLNEIENFCIDVGGDILTKGLNKNGKPWKIGVRDPFAPDKFIQILTISGQAVATSGGYFRKTDKRHHIIDPRTGESPQELTSVTIVADNALVADSYATTVFVMGKEAGLKFLNNDRHAEGLLVTNNREIVATERMKKFIEQ